VGRTTEETEQREECTVLRKLILTAATGAALLAPAAATSAQAHEYYRRHRVYRRHEFRVYIRRCDRDPWCFNGCYGCYEDACRAERSLACSGYEVYVR
jgi:hypothetical protein